MMRPAIVLLTTIALAILSACASTDYDLVKGRVVREQFNHHCIESGPGFVLRWSEFDHNPLIPFAYGGWVLAVELTSAPAAGEVIVIPSANARAAVWSLSHHPGPPSEKLAGTLTVMDNSETYVTIAVDLVDLQTDHRYAGRRRFKLREVQGNCTKPSRSSFELPCLEGMRRCRQGDNAVLGLAGAPETA